MRGVALSAFKRNNRCKTYYNFSINVRNVQMFFWDIGYLNHGSKMFVTIINNYYFMLVELH
jgi:hypothetical protein